VLTFLSGAVVAVVIVLHASLMAKLACLLLARVPMQACPTSMPLATRLLELQQAAYDATAVGVAVLVVLAVAVVVLWSSGLAQQQPELRLCLHVPSLSILVQLVWRAATC